MDKKSVWPVSLKYGLISGLVVVIYSLLLYLIGMDQNRGLGLISYLIMLVIIFLAVKAHRDQDLNGYITVGRSLGVGTALALISGIVMAIYLLLYFNVINPDFINESLRQTREALIDRGMEGEQLEQQLEWTRKFMSPGFMIAFSIIWQVIVGFIGALIAGIIYQKKPSE